MNYIKQIVIGFVLIAVMVVAVRIQITINEANMKKQELAEQRDIRTKNFRANLICRLTTTMLRALRRISSDIRIPMPSISIIIFRTDTASHNSHLK